MPVVSFEKRTIMLMKAFRHCMGALEIQYRLRRQKIIYVYCSNAKLRILLNLANCLRKNILHVTFGVNLFAGNTNTRIVEIYYYIRRVPQKDLFSLLEEL